MWSREDNDHLQAKANVLIERAECILCIARWTTGMSAYHLPPNEKEIHFTAHIAHISFWVQFSCCMIVINGVTVRNLPPQISDIKDTFSADCEILLHLRSSLAQNVLFIVELMEGVRGGERNSCACISRHFWPKTTGIQTWCSIVAYRKVFHICMRLMVANGSVKSVAQSFKQACGKKSALFCHFDSS